MRSQLTPTGRSFVASEDILEDRNTELISVPIRMLMFASIARDDAVFGAAFGQVEEVREPMGRIVSA